MAKRYEVKFTNGKVCVNRPVENEPEKYLHGTVKRRGSKIQLVPDSVDENFNDFFSNFSQKLVRMNLTQKNTDAIILLFEELVKANSASCARFLEKQSEITPEVIDVLHKTRNYVLEKLKTVKSSHRRNKLLEEDPFYVKPVEKAMGLNWKTKITPQLDIPDHRITQTTFSVVKISESLQSLFSDPDFKSLFIKYNEEKHKCVEGVFEDYCCGNVAEYYCRFCVCCKEETRQLTNENVLKRRSVTSYNEQIEKLKVHPELSLKETKGIEKNCLFNRLDNFHVLINLSIDIMHDIFEGVIPFFLKSFFQYCIDKKIASHSDLIRRIRDFNYGVLNNRNKPSPIQISSDHLGQSAIQLYCIMIHMPFIFVVWGLD